MAVVEDGEAGLGWEQQVWRRGLAPFLWALDPRRVARTLRRRRAAESEVEAEASRLGRGVRWAARGRERGREEWAGKGKLGPGRG